MLDAGGRSSEVLMAEAEAEGGRLARSGRLHVLQTMGDARQRGRQHGLLLGTQVKAGAVGLLGRRAALRAGARSGAEKQVGELYAAILAAAPTSLTEELEGLAAASGVDLDLIQRATFLSEALQILAGARTAAAHGACTAAVVSHARAQGGGALHAKNQDYDGGGLWDRFPVVHVAVPTEGLAHVSAGTAGVLKGNLTLNAAGVSVGGHFLFSTQARASGAGFTALEREIALKARTADEAIDLLRGRNIMGAFAFVVTDASGAAYVAECDGSGVTVRPSQEGLLGMANLFSGSEGQARDLLRLAGAHRNPLSRETRLHELLASLPAGAGVADLVAILADRWDCASRRARGPGHAIAHASTVTAAVSDTHRLEFWVGEETAPASAGAFIGFSVADAFSGGQVRVLGAVSGDAGDSDRIVRAFRLFLVARDLFRAGDEARALARLVEAQTLDPQEPAYPRFQARLLIRAGRWSEAEQALGVAVAGEQGANEHAECRLLRGFICDLKGEREIAIGHYEGVAGCAITDDPLGWVNPRLLAMAASRRTRAFTPVDAESLEAPFELTSGIE